MIYAVKQSQTSSILDLCKRGQTNVVAMCALMLSLLCDHYQLQPIIGAKHVKINSIHAEK